MKRIVDYDPLTRITTTFDYDPVSDITYVGREADVEHVLEVNKRLQNEPEYTKAGIKNDWWHYASYPMIIIEKWINEHGVNVFNPEHEKKRLELVNRPEYRYLKTTTKMHAR